jgi:putative flippase GtrA
MMLAQDKERLRFLKFASVGALGSVLDIGVANLLIHVLNMRLVYAGSISFICAVFNNFTLNRYWTYPDSRSRPFMHQLGMFFIVNSVGIAIRIPILHFVEPLMAQEFESLVHLSHSTAESLAKNATLILAIGVVMMWNFFVNRYWTYNDVD